jgi:hypothetical protein
MIRNPECNHKTFNSVSDPNWIRIQLDLRIWYQTQESKKDPLKRKKVEILFFYVLNVLFWEAGGF